MKFKLTYRQYDLFVDVWSRIDKVTIVDFSGCSASGPTTTCTFVADFANAERWDPGVASSVRSDPGPVGVGARYRLGIRMRGRVVPMDYVVTAYDPPKPTFLGTRTFMP